ncbi:MAG: Lipoprotein-releasing system ATP-binding protein LolD [candidate division BRC1 bacterium ADurb.BinA364]|nr:MAG: Lipoprotein-releasing system ATP-binding protein LolD [candidate division BRC1 bacterium ADurb.BinA364]
MLVLENATKTYIKDGKEVRALDGVSLAVPAGEFVVARGPSGCGKSTLLLTAGALLRPDSGRVSVDGQDPYAMGPEARAMLRARVIGFVFQQFHLAPYLTVRENVLAASLALRLPGAETRADELIERFQLADRANHLPAELSTGQKQRAALARALLNRPKLLLADEPTGNLDPGNASVVLEHIADFVREGGAALMVTHDAQADHLATRIVAIDRGRLQEHAAAPSRQTE